MQNIEQNKMKIEHTNKDAIKLLLRFIIPVKLESIPKVNNYESASIRASLKRNFALLMLSLFFEH